MKEKENQKSRNRKPWPTKDAMQQVYEMNLWGGNDTEFFSGDGSHQPEIIDPYIKALTTFLTSFINPLSVCDLGCGDFNVGKHLAKHTEKYVGVDIVPELIKRNKDLFKERNLEFHCLDIAKDELPHADCAILRQVLQHLSNAEVKIILDKLGDYKYVILTEHIPEGDFKPNKDIIAGQGTRLKKRSGLDVFAPPFDFKVMDEKELVSVTLDDGRGVIETFMFRIF